MAMNIVINELNYSSKTRHAPLELRPKHIQNGIANEDFQIRSDAERPVNARAPDTGGSTTDGRGSRVLPLRFEGVLHLPKRRKARDEP